MSDTQDCRDDYTPFSELSGPSSEPEYDHIQLRGHPAQEPGNNPNADVFDQLRLKLGELSVREDEEKEWEASTDGRPVSELLDQPHAKLGGLFGQDEDHARNIPSLAGQLVWYDLAIKRGLFPKFRKPTKATWLGHNSAANDVRAWILTWQEFVNLHCPALSEEYYVAAIIPLFPPGILRRIWNVTPIDASWDTFCSQLFRLYSRFSTSEQMSTTVREELVQMKVKSYSTLSQYGEQAYRRVRLLAPDMTAEELMIIIGSSGVPDVDISLTTAREVLNSLIGSSSGPLVLTTANHAKSKKTTQTSTSKGKRKKYT
jgi:hypothetical protein